MKTRTLPLLALFAAAALAAPPLTAGRLPDDALALVPPGAASVGMVRLSDLRTSPLSAEIFKQTDHITVDGDAARFLEEARLNAKEDVDTVVVAGSPKGGLRQRPRHLRGALRSREDRHGARRARRGQEEHLARRLPAPPRARVERRCDPRARRARAHLRHLLVAGTEDAVERALADRASGGSGFASGSGLGRQLSRVDAAATAWALVDTSKFPEMRERASSIHVDGDINGTPIPAILGAMKSVSLFSLQATVKGDGVKLEALGVTDNAETRDLLEDTLRGALAALRLAMQEKNPDAVSVIRKFKVKGDGDSVTVSGTLPGAAVRALMEHHKSGNGKSAGTD